MPKPKPFSRPSVSISSPDDRRREWQHLPIEDVVEGDTIAEFGELDFKEYQGTAVVISSTFGRVERLDAGTKVHVYAYPPKEPQ